MAIFSYRFFIILNYLKSALPMNHQKDQKDGKAYMYEADLDSKRRDIVRLHQCNNG